MVPMVLRGARSSTGEARAMEGTEDLKGRCTDGTWVEVLMCRR